MTSSARGRQSGDPDLEIPHVPVQQQLDSLLRVEFGDAVVAVTGDVSQLDDNKRAVGETVGAFGRLDVFVGNAGVFDNFLSLADFPEQDLLQHLLARRAIDPGRRGFRSFLVSLVSDRRTQRRENVGF